MATPVTTAAIVVPGPRSAGRMKVAKRKLRRSAVPDPGQASASHGPDVQVNAHLEQVAEGPRSTRAAIFSLFDPVVAPGNYESWLKRVPRSRDAAPTWATPYFAKRQV